MNKQHLRCEHLLRDTNKEYKRLIDSLDGLLRGSTTAEEVNETIKDVIRRVDNLLDDYQLKN